MSSVKLSKAVSLMEVKESQAGETCAWMVQPSLDAAAAAAAADASRSAALPPRVALGALAASSLLYSGLAWK